MNRIGNRIGIAATLVLAAMIGINTVANGQAKKGGAEKGKTSAMTFEVYKDKGGEFRYRMVDESGTNLGGSSKGYEKKEEVLTVVNTIKKGAASAKIDDQTGKK